MFRKIAKQKTLSLDIRNINIKKLAYQEKDKELFSLQKALPSMSTLLTEASTQKRLEFKRVRPVSNCKSITTNSDIFSRISSPKKNLLRAKSSIAYNQLNTDYHPIKLRFNPINKIDFEDRSKLKKVPKVSTKMSTKIGNLRIKFNQKPLKTHNNTTISISSLVNNKNLLKSYREEIDNVTKNYNNFKSKNKKGVVSPALLKKMNFKCCQSSTIKFKTNYECKKDIFLNKLLIMTREDKVAFHFKRAIIFKSLKTLWKNYPVIIEKLINNYTEYKWFLEKEEYIRKAVFIEFLDLIKISRKYQSFCDEIYLIFDHLDNNTIHLKELFFYLIITSKKDFHKEKLSFIANIISDKNSGDLNLKEVLYLLKSVMVEDQSNYNKKIFDLLSKTFNYSTKNEFSYITKEEFISFIENNNYILNTLKMFEYTFHNCDNYYEQELLNSFRNNMNNSRVLLLKGSNDKYCQSNVNKFIKIYNSIIHKEDVKEKNELVFQNNND